MTNQEILSVAEDRAFPLAEKLLQDILDSLNLGSPTQPMIEKVALALAKEATQQISKVLSI